MLKINSELSVREQLIAEAVKRLNANSEKGTWVELTPITERYYKERLEFFVPQDLDTLYPQPEPISVDQTFFKFTPINDYINATIEGNVIIPPECNVGLVRKSVLRSSLTAIQVISIDVVYNAIIRNKGYYVKPK